MARPRRVMTNFRLDPWQVQALRALADATDTSQNELVRAAIDAMLTHALVPHALVPHGTSLLDANPEQEPNQ